MSASPTSSAPVIVVSGLPRSGTSMLMQMLAAGGMPALTDHQRATDEDNLRGYYEYEPVKRLRGDPRGSRWRAVGRRHASAAERGCASSSRWCS